MELPERTSASTYAYAAYGMTIRVPFRCAGLPAAGEEAPADVVVEEGPVPRGLASPVVRESTWDAEPGRFLLRGGRRAGRFLVAGGRVTLARNPGAEDRALASCFTDRVLAAVLRQRGLLVLHANSAVTPRGVVVIAGASGAGKSTMLAALLARRCAMLADDTSALRLTADGHVEALPGVAQVHLTEAAASGLGYDMSTAAVQPWRRMKAAIPTDRSMARSPGRPRALYLLDTHPGSELLVSSLTGAEKFDALQSSIYGPLFPGEHPALFPLCAAVVDQVEVHRIKRPQDLWSTEKLADLLLDSADGALG
jgi:hypothetical protein